MITFDESITLDDRAVVLELYQVPKGFKYHVEAVNHIERGITVVMSPLAPPPSDKIIETAKALDDGGYWC